MKKGLKIILLVFSISWLLPSCEKEVFDVSPTMEAYYTESVQLPAQTLDSVRSFSSKVEGYTRTYPEAKEHKRYPLIMSNIKAASIRISIMINDEWAGQDTIRF